MTVYTVHDVVAETWSFPQVSPTVASARREFELLKSRPGVPGSDLECVIIGSWDPNRGCLEATHTTVLVPADRKEANEV